MTPYTSQVYCQLILNHPSSPSPYPRLLAFSPPTGVGIVNPDPCSKRDLGLRLGVLLTIDII